MDAVWLSFSASRLYKPALGDLLAAQPRLVPAVLFYVFYIAGMVWFAVRPGLATGPAGGAVTAAQNGALLGALCYMTYDLTNQATLARWAWSITIADVLWGAFATGMASAITCIVVRRFA